MNDEWDYDYGTLNEIEAGFRIDDQIKSEGDFAGMVYALWEETQRALFMAWWVKFA